jgi:hypothetical protein
MPTLVSTGQFTIVDVNDGPISNLTPPSELTSVVADSMGGWTRLSGALSNSSIVNNQVGPNGEYPRILRVVGDGTIIGWYTLWRYWFKVDISKAYVTYCWVRKRSATSTNLYLGWTNGANFVDTLAGVNDTNPYFIPAHNPAIADKWYLCVGVIWPSGYGSGDTGLAGVYDPYTGVRVYDGAEFRHNTGATQQYLRFGFYNNVTAQSSADGYDFLPVGTYCMDGTHPTKEAIMNTVPAAMTAALSKETYVFPANSDGSVPAASYTGSGTQIRVYQGAAELTYDGTGTAKGTWRIASTSATNITIGSITDSGTFATVADHSGVAAGTDTSTITYNIQGTTLTGASFTLVKTQTFAKAKGGVPGSNGVRTAVLDMYRWSATAPSTFPAGSSTYTWATGAFTAPATTNSWTLVPDLPVAGQTLYIARQIFTDTGTSATSSVTWNVSSSIAYSSAGVNGQRVGILELYQWAAVAPTTFPAGTSTYTWATGAFTAPGTPNSWSLTPGAPSTGQTLWATSVRVSNNDTTATSTVTWNSSTAYAVGYAGSNGQPGERGSKEFFATGGSWSDTTANTAISNAGLTKVLLDQVTISNGTSFAETRFWNGTAWATISQVINGNLLVNGTVGANALVAGTVLANVFNVGSTNFQLDGAAQGAGKGALFVKNGANTILTAGYLDGSTVGLSLKDAAGNIIMQTAAAAGGTTPTNTYNNAISNSNIAINASGQLTGIGTGANTIVDNTKVTVGGKNLLLGTASGAGWSGFTSRTGSTFTLTAASATETAYIYSPYFNMWGNQEITVSFESTENASILNRDFYVLPDNHATIGLLAQVFNKTTPSSTWQKYSFTFTTPSGWGTIQAPASVRFRMDHNGSTGGVSAAITIRNVKIELGNKATDWSLAPEDLVSVDLTNAPSSIRNSSITVDGNGILQGAGTSNVVVNNNAITVDLNGVLQGAGTSNVVVNNGAIAINGSGQITGIGGGVNTTVANNQITISSGNLNGIGTGSGTAVANDSVRSGGVNLVGNSGFLRHNGIIPTNWGLYNNGAPTVTATTSVQAGGLFGQNYYRVTSNAATTQQLGIYVVGNSSDSVKSWLPGQTYCISFWAKGSAGMLGKTMEGFYSNMGFTNGVALENPVVTANWQRYVFRGIPANNANTPVGELYISWNVTGTLASGSVLDITCPKVELGSQPSSWTPSPQDTLNQNVTIASNGTLSGAGGGQVSIGGLGYTGELNATNGANIETNLSGTFNATRVGTFFQNASISAAQIGSIALVGTLPDGTTPRFDVRTAASGQRIEMNHKVIKVYDSSNVLRVQLGDLSA